MNGVSLSRLEEDFRRKGRGRKAWWARKLGIPPLTLSHWLSGRQKPNGRHAIAIREILDDLERAKKSLLWENSLWECYFTGQKIPKEILPLVVLEVVSNPCLRTRTVALLIRILRGQDVLFEKPTSGALQNRLGWLLETAGFKSPFPPNRLEKTRSLFFLPSDKAYLKRHQTPTGRKWKIRDCSLERTLESLP